MPRSARAKKLPLVRLLATGGTIAGAQSDPAAPGYRAGAVSVETLAAALPSLAAIARLDCEPISAIGSQDMNETIWCRLAARTRAALASPTIAGVVITHGTDTMEETAFFLSLVLRSPKPIVLTGAMRPATATDADGPANLFNAIAVAASPAARHRGVLVVLAGQIHRARDVVKTHTLRLDTFQSPTRGPVGTIRAGRVHFPAPPEKISAPRPFSLPPEPLPRVDLIHAHAGMDGALITAAVHAGARGLVLAGVGDGNLAAPALAALIAAARRGVAVVRATRIAAGPVLRNIEIDDDAHGFVAAGDHPPAKARVLLQLALTRTRDPRALQKLFLAP